ESGRAAQYPAATAAATCAATAAAAGSASRDPDRERESRGEGAGDRESAAVGKSARCGGAAAAPTPGPYASAPKAASRPALPLRILSKFLIRIPPGLPR